jgi:hypothetical protein
MIDRSTFFNKVRANPFGGSMSQLQVDGMNYMLDVFEKEYNWSDDRWLAYAFATAYHETAYTMMPVKEYGGQSYLQGKPYYPYVGRGYVQLTWEENYKKMGTKLGVNLLGSNMDRALEPGIASEVMYVGMRDGDFTGKKLATYFSATVDDPVNARRIINGTDKASTIAGYHNAFLSALKAASVVAPSPPPPLPPEQPSPDMSKYVTREELANILADMAETLRAQA